MLSHNNPFLRVLAYSVPGFEQRFRCFIRQHWRKRERTDATKLIDAPLSPLSLFSRIFLQSLRCRTSQKREKVEMTRCSKPVYRSPCSPFMFCLVIRGIRQRGKGHLSSMHLWARASICVFPPFAGVPRRCAGEVQMRSECHDCFVSVITRPS